MSRLFACGVALGADPHELVNTCLNQLGDVTGYRGPGFIFCTDALARDLGVLLPLLQRATGIEQWLGTIGMGICATDLEIYDRPAMSLLLADWDPESYRIIPGIKLDCGDFLQSHRKWIIEHNASIGLLHGDPTNPATPTLVETLCEHLDGGFFTGALTSSQAEQLQVAGDSIVHGGISGVLLSSQIPIIAGHSQGCSPLGQRHLVTEAHRNIIRTLDHARALDQLKQDVGEVLARNLDRLGGYIFIGLPVRGSDTGDYMVRNLMGIDPEQGLLAVGDLIEQGDEIIFCRRDGNTARTDMLRMLQDLKRRAGRRQILGGIYYSCLGRGRYQFGDDSEELKMISSVFGSIPLAGFFANGEIFHNRLYGYTGVLTLFLGDATTAEQPSPAA